MPFVKLDCGILDSSLWPDKACRDIFITALLMARPAIFNTPTAQLQVNSIEPSGWEVPPGKYGLVESSGVGLLRRAIVSEEEGFPALKRLGEPDENSRTGAFGGRRLVRIDGGYLVLNYMLYREMDYTNAERQQQFRERRRSGQNDLIKSQSGLCDCCGEPLQQPYSKYVVQDHSHKDLYFRGIICSSCNKVVGDVENGRDTISPKVSIAKEYISKWEKLYKGGVTLRMLRGNGVTLQSNVTYAYASVHSSVPSVPVLIGEGDLPGKEEAVRSVTNAGVDPGFAGYVYDDWASRGGKDCGGNLVPFVAYATKRWNREREEWVSGRHKGNRVNGERPTAPAPVWEQIKILEEEISKHPANRQSVYFCGNPTELQRASLKASREKLASLRKQQVA